MFADLVLEDRAQRVKLRIPGALLRQTEAAFRASDPIYEELRRFTQAEGPLRLTSAEVKQLAGKLAAACATLSPDLEEGALVWIAPRITGALLRKTPAEMADEGDEEASEVGLLKSPAVLALALQRGLMTMHLMDQWWVRQPHYQEEVHELSDAE